MGMDIYKGQGGFSRTSKPRRNRYTTSNSSDPNKTLRGFVAFYRFLLLWLGKQQEETCTLSLYLLPLEVIRFIVRLSLYDDPILHCPECVNSIKERQPPWTGHYCRPSELTRSMWKHCRELYGWPLRALHNLVISGFTVNKIRKDLVKSFVPEAEYMPKNLIRSMFHWLAFSKDDQEIIEDLSGNRLVPDIYPPPRDVQNHITGILKFNIFIILWAGHCDPDHPLSALPLEIIAIIVNLSINMDDKYSYMMKILRNQWSKAFRTLMLNPMFFPFESRGNSVKLIKSIMTANPDATVSTLIRTSTSWYGAFVVSSIKDDDTNHIAITIKYDGTCHVFHCNRDFPNIEDALAWYYDYEPTDTRISAIRSIPVVPVVYYSLLTYNFNITIDY